MSVDIVFDRVDRTYKPGEKVSGVVVVRSQGSMSHNGIKLSVNGSVSLQLSARSVGLFEAFYSSIKPVELVQYNIDVAQGGKIPSGATEFPFAFILKGFNGRALQDTYHGVYVNTQYIVSVEIPRSMLAKNLKKSLEFIVEVPSETLVKPEPLYFCISPESLQNVRKGAQHKIPEFKFEGTLDSVVCDITKPFKGEFTVKACAIDIKSVELQLVRVESCTYMEGEAREATEIQNVQIADGNIVHDLTIPIYMVFPRLFTCTTTTCKAFRVEFEVNLIVLFADNHMVTENFPIKLYRS